MLDKDKLQNWKLNEIQVKYNPEIFDVVLDDPDIVKRVLCEIWDQDLINIQEQFYVLYLNHSLKLIGWKLLNTGNINSVNVDIKLLVTLALKTLATHVIIAHNHPSGNPRQSKADLQLDRKLTELLGIFDIELLESVILTPDESKYYLSSENESVWLKNRAYKYNGISKTYQKNGFF